MIHKSQTVKNKCRNWNNLPGIHEISSDHNTTSQRVNCVSKQTSVHIQNATLMHKCHETTFLSPYVSGLPFPCEHFITQGSISGYWIIPSGHIQTTCLHSTVAINCHLQPPNLRSMHKTITTYGRLISISSSNLLWAVGSQRPLRGPGLVVWHIPCSLVTRFLHPVFPIAVLVPMCWIRGLQ